MAGFPFPAGANTYLSPIQQDQNEYQPASGTYWGVDPKTFRTGMYGAMPPSPALRLLSSSISRGDILTFTELCILEAEWATSERRVRLGSRALCFFHDSAQYQPKT
jgi:hypothetical protein